MRRPKDRKTDISVTGGGCGRYFGSSLRRALLEFLVKPIKCSFLKGDYYEANSFFKQSIGSITLHVIYC